MNPCTLTKRKANKRNSGEVPSTVLGKTASGLPPASANRILLQEDTWSRGTGSTHTHRPQQARKSFVHSAAGNVFIQLCCAGWEWVSTEHWGGRGWGSRGRQQPKKVRHRSMIAVHASLVTASWEHPVEVTALTLATKISLCPNWWVCFKNLFPCPFHVYWTPTKHTHGYLCIPLCHVAFLCGMSRRRDLGQQSRLVAH